MARRYKQIASSNWQPSGKRKEWQTIIYYRMLLAFAVVGGIAILTIFAVSSYYAFGGNSFSILNQSEASGAGKTITVRAGGDFQDALNKANAGDTILLEAGATFKGAFKLPNKKGAEFITIRTSASDAQIPPSNKRLQPEKYAALLPKLVNPNGGAVVETTTGAHHFRFIGIEFGSTLRGEGNIVQIGTSQEKTLAELPHHLEFDRCFFKGSPTEGQRRGLAANGKFIRVLNSYFKDIKRKGEESQGIAVWAGESNFEFANNYIEAAAEGILFGGAGSELKLVASDISVHDNTITRPVAWRTEGWVVKNLFELKNARRAVIERNLMMNNWGGGQDGTGILFTVRAQGTDNATIDDVVFANNIIQGSGGAINILGSEGAGGKNLTIRNNIFADIDGAKWSGGGQFLTITEWNGLTIENNTVINSGNITRAYGKPTKNFIFRNNIIAHNEYGFAGDGSLGQVALDNYFPNADVSFNAIVGGDGAKLRGRNAYPASWNLVGFMDFGKGDYRLKSDSKLRTAGFNGRIIGTDLDPKTIGGQ